jgi:hypothetical protein
VVGRDHLPTRTCCCRCVSVSASARGPADFAAIAPDAQARRRSRRAATMATAPGGRGSPGTAAGGHECIPARRRVRVRILLATTPARYTALPLVVDRPDQEPGAVVSLSLPLMRRRNITHSGCRQA